MESAMRMQQTIIQSCLAWKQIKKGGRLNEAGLTCLTNSESSWISAPRHKSTN